MKGAAINEIQFMSICYNDRQVKYTVYSTIICFVIAHTIIISMT